MTESVEVKLARLEEKVDTLLRQFVTHREEVRDLRERMEEQEKGINKLWGGLAFATVIIPMIIRYLMGG
jgi:predicted  nucleic acid-binding Zn-ribbon protein